MIKYIRLTVLLLSLYYNSYSQMNINTNIDAQILSQSIQGQGIIINSITYSNQSNNVKTIALFDQINSNLPITSGIVLSTGNVLNVNQAGNVLMSDNLNLPGIQEINNIIGSTTYDGVFIQIDFVPLENFIELTYCFASEEYPEYVCSNNNDAIAMILIGPDPYNTYNTNIALIPNTNLPVSINSINPGMVGSYGYSSNCLSLNYSQFYINNENGINPVFDGLTTELVARAQVIPNQLYRLKIAIADAQDNIYDSGLFLKANSFRSVSTICDVSTYNTFCGNCYGSAIINIQTNSPNPPYTYQYSNNIVHQSNSTSDTLTNLCSGSYYVTVTDANENTFISYFVISNNPDPITVNYLITEPSCPGYSDGCVQITNIQGGIAPYTINWGNVCLNNTTNYCCEFTSGTHQITIIDNSQCTKFLTIYMPYPPLTYAHFEYTISNDTVYFINYSSEGSYLWSFGDGTTSTLKHPSHSYAAIGTYNVCLTVFSCDTITYCETIFLTNVSNTYTNLVEVTPNPFYESINIFIDNTESAEIDIYNTLGEKVYSGLAIKGWTTINTNSLNTGIYILMVKSDNYTIAKKLIKK